jgi:hypothetical protein
VPEVNSELEQGSLFLKTEEKEGCFKKIKPWFNLWHQIHFMHLVLSSGRRAHSTHNVSVSYAVTHYTYTSTNKYIITIFVQLLSI